MICSVVAACVAGCGVWTEYRTVCSRKMHSTQYTHHNLKYMLPQYCKTYNDVFLLINSTKV